jgi:CheY-like chemotaxis protein
MSTEASASLSTSAEEAPLKGIRLLVVDDSKINLLVAKKLLLHAGASVDIEYDGSTALAWLKKNGGQVDLVLLDVQMPIMDGLTAVGLIRADPALRHLPVLAMTAADSDAERAHALACGMTGHVLKPFNLKSMVTVVLQHVRPGAAAAQANVVADDFSAATDWPEIDGIQTQQAQSSYLGDRASFLKQLRRLLKEFEGLEQPSAVPTNGLAWATLAMQMHKLVGNAGLLAAQPLAMAARQAEGLAKARQVQGLAAALQAVADRLVWLRQAAAAVLSQPVQASQPARARPTVDTVALDAWVQDLEKQKFSAVKRFNELKPVLVELFDAEQFDNLSTAMDCLEFDAVLELVKPLAAARWVA